MEIFRRKNFSFFQNYNYQKVQWREIGNAMLYYSKHRLMVFIRLLNVEEFSKNSKRERERETRGWCWLILRVHGDRGSARWLIPIRTRVTTFKQYRNNGHRREGKLTWPTWSGRYRGKKIGNHNGRSLNGRAAFNFTRALAVFTV